MNGPYASAMQYRAIMRQTFPDERHVWEFVHMLDPGHGGGWAFPHPDSAEGEDLYVGVRRCTPEQWADGSAADAADTLEHARDQALHRPPPAVFPTGVLGLVALDLTEASPAPGRG